MARLDLDAAPPTALPAAGLVVAAVWGTVAGVLLALDGPLATASRWTPSALALVHALTLGVFVNAATGALLQFLPAAAGVRVAGGTRAGVAVLALLNLGALLLVGGFRAWQPPMLLGGGVMVAGAVFLLTAITVPGLLRRGERDTMHAGLALAVGVLAVTAAFGLAMACGLVIAHGLAPARWIDVHAAWGLGGAAVLLLASVGQQVLPMFQGVDAVASRRFGAGIAVLAAALLAVAATRGATAALAVLGGCIALGAASTLARQSRTRRHRRNGVLFAAWASACLATIAAVAAGALDARIAGAIALTLALPLFLVSMLLEITAFLAWLALHRQVRGRVPGVHALQPTREKARVMALHAGAGLACVCAVTTGSDALAHVAGASLATAYAAVLVALLRLQQRCAVARRTCTPRPVERAPTQAPRPAPREPARVATDTDDPPRAPPTRSAQARDTAPEVDEPQRSHRRQRPA